MTFYNDNDYNICYDDGGDDDDDGGEEDDHDEEGDDKHNGTDLQGLGDSDDN